jgi:hypothetical protein
MTRTSPQPPRRPGFSPPSPTPALAPELLVTDPHKWLIHGERLVDDTPHIRVSLADAELPNQVRFTQYVFRMRRCAMTVVLDDAGERVLLMRRHRFIVDRWVWELPGASWAAFASVTDSTASQLLTQSCVSHCRS